MSETPVPTAADTEQAGAANGSGRAAIGVTGLAVMGHNLARNLARHGFTVALHNRTQARTDALVASFGHEGDFVSTTTIAEFAAALERPRRAIIMVQAGPGTDAVIDELATVFEPGDIIADGGNAHVEDTRRREKVLREKGIHFVGTGISGGEEGALLGPSIMPGGSPEAYEAIGPILTEISAKVNGEPCCTHIGSDGAGHFVKMVHNGIEYADMQLIAEAYDILRRTTGMPAGELAEVFTSWNQGDLESFLIEITAEVLGHVDARTGKPFVDIVQDAAEQKGTGRWTVQTALDLGVPVSGIAEAVFARSLSGHLEQRAAARGLAGGTGEVAIEDRQQLIDDVRGALYASKVVAYAQGFDQIAAAAKEYGWKVDLGAISKIWRGGCIIRARFLDRIADAYERRADLESLLVDDYFAGAMERSVEAWRRVVALAVASGVPTPGFSSSLAYYDGLRADRLPANLIQGLRDFFGAHTYRRVDADGVFHTLWSGDRSEVQV
jgi:6-phosphogluconate dehydrogenase